MKVRESFEAGKRKTEKALELYKGAQLEKAMSKLHQSFLDFLAGHFEKQGETLQQGISGVLQAGISGAVGKFERFIPEVPETILIRREDKNSGKEKRVSVPYRKVVAWIIHNRLLPGIKSRLTAFETCTGQLYLNLKNIILLTNDYFLQAGKTENNGKNTGHELFLQIDESFASLETMLQEGTLKMKSGLQSVVRNSVSDIAADFADQDVKKRLKSRNKTKRPAGNDEIVAFSEDWTAKARLLNNSLRLDCQVLLREKIISGIVFNLIEKVYSEYAGNVLNPAGTILSNIELAGKNPKAELKKVQFIENSNIKHLFEESYYRISEILDGLPEELELADYRNPEESTGSQVADIVPVVVEPAKMARFYFDTKFYEPFYRELEQLEFLTKQTINEFREVNSMLRFRMANFGQEALMPGDDEKNFASLLDKLKKQVEEERDKLNQELGKLAPRSQGHIKNALSPLFSHAITLSGKVYSSLVRDQRSRLLGRGFSKGMVTLEKTFNNLVLGLLYGSSGGMIQAKKMLKKEKKTTVTAAQLLDIAGKIMPDKKILSQIPVFYRTLFSSKSLINDEFWVPMEKEAAEIKAAIQHHRNGKGGAVMITGVHGSGKTVLSRQCATRHFKKDRIYTIQPPPAGSVQIEEWQAAVQKATGLHGTAAEIFRSIPHESVVIVNDLELWWERTNQGCAVLEEMMALIRSFGHKVFFILNGNRYAIQLINKIIPLSEYCISVVECQPFTARKLQHLIQSRHKSSGLSFVYKNTSEEQLPKIKTAALFNSFFTVSEGIPGVAMNFWLGCIRKVQDQTLYIEKPEIPDTESLNYLDAEWLVAATLFIHHKNLNLAKLARLLDVDVNGAGAIILKLENAGLIELREPGVYTLSRILEPYIVKICEQKGLI